jgi:hypothetical protein
MRCLDHQVSPPDKAQNKNETCLTTVQPSYQNNAVAQKPMTGDTHELKPWNGLMNTYARQDTPPINLACFTNRRARSQATSSLMTSKKAHVL